jgi:hypothetical protein
LGLSLSPRAAGLLAAAIGAGLVGWSLWQNRVGDPMPTATATTDGTVTFYGVTHKPQTQTSVVRVDFVYKVNGRTLDGFARAEVPSDRIPDVPQYRSGDRLTVRYVPTDPEQALVDDFHGRLPIYQEPNFFIGAGLIVLGLLYAAGRRPSAPPAAAS